MKVYAVAGNPISHSKSPIMMNQVMYSLKMDALYTRILAKDVEDIALLAEDIPLAGLNITAPFKKDILQLARSMDLIVQSMGAANTLNRDRNGFFSAQNTDVKGVRDAVAYLFHEETVQQSETEENENTVKKVLILGSGGAAPAAIKALETFHCEIFLSGRNIEKTRDLAGKTGVKTVLFTHLPQKIADFSLIINTIPIKIPLFDQFSFLPEQHILDAPYSNPPLKEKCLSEGAQYISGEKWLIHQAIHAFKNFTGKWVDREKFAEAIRLSSTNSGSKARFPSVALIGPMGAGKTTVGQMLAEKLGYDWVDTDQQIESETGMRIEEIFRQKGENYFRQLEQNLLRQLVLRDKIVISCGGGMVLDESSRKLLTNHFHTIFLYVKAGKSIKRIGKTDDRPLLKGSNPVQKAYELLQDRLPHYLSTAWFVINTQSGDARQITELIYEDYRQTFIN